MNDNLISSKALIEQIKAIGNAVNTEGVNDAYNTGFHTAISTVCGLTATMPAVDAVPVVRCKDCCFAVPVGEEMIGCIANRDLNGNYKTMGEYNYCSYAQRRVKA